MSFAFYPCSLEDILLCWNYYLIQFINTGAQIVSTTILHLIDTPSMSYEITFVIGCHYACYMRELEKKFCSKENFYCEKVYTSLMFCNSWKTFMSTNCLQYLFYCIVISMKPNLLLLLDLYVGSGRATFLTY